jgi:hypothetical protein
MGLQQSSGFCKHCREQVRITRNGSNNLLHFLVTIILGLLTAQFAFIGAFIWLFIWFGSSIRFGGWRCVQCGRPASATIGAGEWAKVGFALAAVLVVYAVAQVIKHSNA